jgi:signal transduction histidine kinase
LAGALVRLVDRCIALLEVSTPEAEQLLRRVATMERDIVLPVKAAFVIMILHSFYHGRWIRTPLDEALPDESTIAVEWTRYFFLYYIPANVCFAAVLLAIRRVPLGLVQWVVFASGLVDVILLSALTVLTPGYQSPLFWLFLALIVRSAVSVPRATSQLALHITIILCYVIAGTINIQIANGLKEKFTPPPRRPMRHTPATVSPRPGARPREAQAQPGDTNLSAPGARQEAAARAQPGPSETRPPATAAVPGAPNLAAVAESRARSSAVSTLDEAETPAEPLLVRLALLVLMSVCSYGVQVLLERQRQAMDEAREFAAREGQLRAAGRLAAEFVHQIKNPLAIINNAAFSLQRALKQGRTDVGPQLDIIQEEVERSDRIITQIMGYAQLSEGRVEKLSVTEELDLAIAQVFPPAAGFPVRVHRRYAPPFPPLLMLRRHASEIFTNLLQNARDALETQGGDIYVNAQCRPDAAIEVVIADDGPGIPAVKHSKIFEAYYTTKPKGTGLGLATVKHNVGLYGGSVHVDSELGKGARFTVVFPARTLMTLAEQS